VTRKPHGERIKHPLERGQKEGNRPNPETSFFAVAPVRAWRAVELFTVAAGRAWGPQPQSREDHMTNAFSTKAIPRIEPVHFGALRWVGSELGRRPDAAGSLGSLTPGSAINPNTSAPRLFQFSACGIPVQKTAPSARSYRLALNYSFRYRRTPQ
jgi:hypothetical protein